MDRIKTKQVTLNLPVIESLPSCRSVLIAGMGGGFDVFCGLPIYFALRELGQAVHLANFSFSRVSSLREGARLTDTLVGVTAEQKRPLPYFPERHLAQWFRERRGEAVTVWCLDKTGAGPLLANYHVLVEHLSVDGILLIDGGVDSLMRGDETQMGTLLEDDLSLWAVGALEHVPVRLLACLGMGAEQDLSYAHMLENIAGLAQARAFLGSCSLTGEMEVYQAYEDAVSYVHGRRFQEPSVINASIVSAVRGHYGDYHLTDKTQGSTLWISPLMAIYWFFDLKTVAERHFFLSQLGATETFRDATVTTLQAMQMIPRRTPARIPLP